MKKILFLLLFILASITANAETYYVKNGGNDALDGLTDATAWATVNKVNTTISAGDIVLFKRGSIWRERFVAVGGTPTKYTYYGAYGTGAKPLFLGSDEKNELTDWSESSTNVWKCATTYTDDIGNIIFNNEASVGIKCMTATPLPDSLDAQGDFWFSHAGDTLLLYSVGNPASVYTDIELAKSWEGISPEITKHYITWQNLDWRYWGDFVREQGGNYVNFFDCDISYCGGAEVNDDYTARFGGALQCYSYDGHGNHDITITRCKISQCYDDAITFQGYSGLYETYNLFAQYNIITDCELPFNFYHRSVTGATTHHIYIENNTVIRAAGGWGHTQRPDPTMGHSLRIYNYTASKSDIYIRNNIFYESANRLVRLYRLTDLDNIKLDNNLYYSSGAVAFIEVVGGGVYNQTYNTLSDWQTITGQEVSGVSGDPLFVGGSPYSYKLQSTSPAIDAGLEVGLSYDYDGKPIYLLPDIGALEQQAFPASIGLGWKPKYFKENVRDTLNIDKGWKIKGETVTTSARTLNKLVGLINTAAEINHVTDKFVAGDTTVTPKLGRIVFQASDSSAYVCRSTTWRKKWYKMHD